MNIEIHFNQFNKSVPTSKLSINDKVNLFVQLITNPELNYLHPSQNLIITENFGEVKCKREDFEAFFNHFQGMKYSPREKEKIVSTLDRLIDDTTRRAQGEFFTPTAFVDLAHEYISREFGRDWKDRYVVWDCGYGQLKRVWKTSHPDQFAAFRSAYKRLCDRMRPLVYELGFLRE